MILSEPTVTDLIEKIKFAIKRHKTGDIVNPIEMHDKIKSMYNWRDVAKRTEIVYNRIQSNKNVDTSLISKIHKYKYFVLLIFLYFKIFIEIKIFRFRNCGYLGYYVISFIFILDFLLISFLEYLNPADKIDKSEDISNYKNNKKQM